MQIAAAREGLEEVLHSFVKWPVLLCKTRFPGEQQIFERVFNDLLERVGSRPGPVAGRARGGTGEHEGTSGRLREDVRQGSGRRGKGKAGVVL